MNEPFWKIWSLNKVEAAVIALDKLFNDGKPTMYSGILISNTVYDYLRQRLIDERPDSKALENVNNSENSPLAVVFEHYPPFCSLKKINREEEKDKYTELVEWLNERQDDMQWDNFSLESGVLPMFCQAYKLDGVALRVYYENGLLVRAGLRPHNAVHAEDVTKNVKYIKGIPQSLTKPYTFSISGEVICRISDFIEINKGLAKQGKKLRANPRNHTAGSIRLFNDPTKTKDGKLEFIGYSIDNFIGKPPYKDEIERAVWSNKVLKIPFVQIRPFRVQDLKKMEENVKNLDYEVDGVVISVRDLEQQEQCGRHGKSLTANPKGKIAWKFKETAADVKVTQIILQCGRTGRVTPVLAFEPVPLAGTMVSRATAHNYGFLERNKIGVGTIVRIIKSGKIIPKVIEVMANHSSKGIYPVECPCCEHALTIRMGGKIKGTDQVNKDLICKNKDCPAKNVQRILHYLKTFGVKGIGDAIVGELVEKGVVSDLTHLYQLTEGDFEFATDLSERQALLAIADIHMIPNPSQITDNKDLRALIVDAKKYKKKIKGGKFLAALGVPNVAEVTGDTLVQEFGSIEGISQASIDELLAAPDVGKKTAESVRDYFDLNFSKVKALLKFIDIELPKQGKLTGKTFVLSGTLPLGKAHWKKLIEEKGGIVKDSVGSTTDYLVAGDGSGTKSDKAKELNISIIDTDDLEKILKK